AVESFVHGMAWHPNGDRLATAGQDRFVTLWNAETGEKLDELRGHLGDPVSLGFNPRGDLLASSGWDGVIRLWDVALGQNIVTIPGGGLQLRFDTAGRSLGCFTWNGTLPQIMNSPMPTSFEPCTVARPGRARAKAAWTSVPTGTSLRIS